VLIEDYYIRNCSGTNMMWGFSTLMCGDPLPAAGSLRALIGIIGRLRGRLNGTESSCFGRRSGSLPVEARIMKIQAALSG